MSNKLALFWRQSWLLMFASAFFGGLLALTNAAWSPRIEQNQKAKFDTLAGGAQGLLAAASKFETMPDTISVIAGSTTYPVELKKGLDASGGCVGWVFQIEAAGFADKIKMVVATDAAFEKLIGFDVLTCSETPGFGDKIMIKGGFYQAQFQGAPAGELSLIKMGDDKKIDAEIVAITGATVTSRAVVNAFNTFVPAVKEAAKQKGYIH